MLEGYKTANDLNIGVMKIELEKKAARIAAATTITAR
jgi:hypothetical protein